MLDKKKFSLSHPNIFLGLCILIAVIIYAFANRYEKTPDNNAWVIDKWTGEIIISIPKKK